MASAAILVLVALCACALPAGVAGFVAASHARALRGPAGRARHQSPPFVPILPSRAGSTRASMCNDTRRDFLRTLGLGGATLSVQIAQPALVSGKDEDDEETAGDDDGGRDNAGGALRQLPKLLSRFAKGQIKTLGPAGPLGPPEVAAPAWLEGEWDVEYTFTQATFPLTKDFAQFKQLLAGSVRSPGEMPGEETQVTTVWKAGKKGVEEDKAANLKNYYNAFSKDLTIDTKKGPRTRKVAWMPILTQRGVYEKVNSITASGSNNFQMVVKEIAPDLSVVGTAPLEGVVVNRKSELAGDAFVVTELYRIKRLSQGKVKMIETGTGDTEVVTAFFRKSDDEIVGSHRVLVYLVSDLLAVPFSGPAGDKYADSAGGAVAVYDYKMTMTRQ